MKLRGKKNIQVEEIFRSKRHRDGELREIECSYCICIINVEIQGRDISEGGLVHIQKKSWKLRMRTDHCT